MIASTPAGAAGNTAQIAPASAKPHILALMAYIPPIMVNIPRVINPTPTPAGAVDGGINAKGIPVAKVPPTTMMIPQTMVRIPPAILNHFLIFCLNLFSLLVLVGLLNFP